MREALNFGVPLIPHVIGGFSIAAADRFIINEKLGLAAAGIYLVAVQLGMGMGLIADACNKAFVPWLYEQLKLDDFGQNGELSRVPGSILAWHWALLLSWPCLLAGSSPLSRAPSTWALQLLWPGLRWVRPFLGCILWLRTEHFFYKRHTKILAWVTFLVGSVGVMIAWFLTPLLEEAEQRWPLRWPCA